MFNIWSLDRAPLILHKSDNHRHIYKEKVKDSFYSEFVLQFEIAVPQAPAPITPIGGLLDFLSKINLIHQYSTGYLQSVCLVKGLYLLYLV